MITFWRTSSCLISWGCALMAECCSLKTFWETRYAAGLSMARDAKLLKSAAPPLFTPLKRNRPKWAEEICWLFVYACLESPLTNSFRKIGHDTKNAAISVGSLFKSSLNSPTFLSLHLGWVPRSTYLWGNTQHPDLWKWTRLGFRRHGPAGIRGCLITRC